MRLFIRGPAWAPVAALFLTTALFSNGVRAEDRPDCPRYSPQLVLEKLSTPKLRELDREFTKASEQCLDDSDFLEQKIRIALALGDLPAALVWAERRVMVAPESPSALMDYAWVARLTGQDFLAREIIAQVLERPDLPEPLRLQLIAWLSTPVDVALRIQTHRVVFGALFGHESNLNNRPKSADIALTFPTGDYVFQLDRAEVARSGPVVSSYGQWAGRIGRGIEQVGDVRVSAQLRQPMVGGERYTTQVAEGQIGLLTRGLRMEAFGLPDRVWGSLAQFRLGGQALLNSLSAGGNWYFEHGRVQGVWGLLPLRPTCASSPGVWVERRDYPNFSESDGAIAGANYAFYCRDLDKRAGLDVFWLRDQAQGPRLGGNTDREGISLSIQTTRPAEISAQMPFLGAGDGLLVGWNLYARLDRARDARGYSELLDFGNPRRIFGRSFGGQISLTSPGSSLTWILRAERRFQSSNISLFDLVSNSVGLGLEWSPR
jgi:hypothetical protein